MAEVTIHKYPPQQIPLSKKTKAWRKECVDFGSDTSVLCNTSALRDVQSMQVNYDLLRGKIHMEDLKYFLNPYNLDASFTPDGIQHYSIINSYVEVLAGEEHGRLFEPRVVVTNPSAVSEIEEAKSKEVNARLQQLVSDTSMSEEDFNAEIEKLADYFQYDYQDKREVMGNCIIQHYSKEYDTPVLYNNGFKDAYTVGIEAYRCDIVGGEPTIEKLDPRKLRIIRSGSSNRIEDADMLIYEDYWSPGRIVDTFGEELTKNDIDKIMNGETGEGGTYYDDDLNPMFHRRLPIASNDEWVAGDVAISQLFDDGSLTTSLPYDIDGNVRVLTVYWKSRRKIKKVKRYDPETGEETFDFESDSYICDKDKGEEETSFWINEAWEGTKIGKDIYVNMRPRIIQYNRLSNPSRCHFGIVGNIYTNNGGDTPFSLVDIMKPYNYLYDVIHDRLNKVTAKNMGKVIRLDFAKVPKGWDVDKWLYYLNVNGIAVENSFNEGDSGRATGVLAGGMNNATSGVIDASLGTEITQYINLLSWISTRMGELAGMSPQRMGQVSNRETVGGVERATLQSSHSTEWLFIPHENLKKRVWECFIETAKIAYKGKKKKFEYILSDGSRQVLEIDGNEFAECDYGLVVDSSNGTQLLNQKIDTLAQAGIQNGMFDMSTSMKLYTSMSINEKIRLAELCEKRMREDRQREFEAQQQAQQQQLQQEAMLAREKAEREYQMHREDNETKILIAKINSRAEELRMSIMNGDNAEANAIEREKIAEESRQFDEKMKLEKKKQEDDAKLKQRAIDKK